MPITKEILAKYRNPIFVETGTYLGGTVNTALEVGFAKIVSIEIDPGNYKNAVARFKDRPQVILIHGNTKAVFADALDHCVGETATFWLDAHGSFFGSVSDGNTTPILSELEAIRKHRIKRHTILIDDMRIFRARNDWATEVSEGDVLEAIKKIGNYSISFEDDDCAPKDILVAIPTGS